MRKIADLFGLLVCEVVLIRKTSNAALFHTAENTLSLRYNSVHYEDVSANSRVSVELFSDHQLATSM